MGTILFLTGSTRGDALGAVTRSIVDIFQKYGLEAIEINFSAPDIMPKLQKILEQKNILFAFSFAGIGRDITITKNGKEMNLWDGLAISFIAVHGDSPAYFFDRHVNPSARFATIYAFREHYEFRKQLPFLTGLFGVSLPLIFNAVPIEEIDFSAKAKGKLIFLKNGNDPVKLRQFWIDKCPPAISHMLCEIADGLEGNLDSDLGGNLDEVVKALFMEKGMDVEALVKLRLFFVAQLDDYFRRVKCNFVADILSDFPVEIHGENWEHMDFSGKKCTFVHGADYRKSSDLIRHSLGTIDLSPNTGGGFHDRPLRAFGMHTLCLTNEQECFIQVFGDNPGFTYKIEKESLQQKIADVLARPQEYVEVGREISRIFSARFPEEETVRSFLEIGDALRLNSTEPPFLGIQDFFVWPPQSLS